MVEASSIIDVRLPVRSVSFEALRDLLIAIEPFVPIRYTDALSLVIDKRAIVSADGENLKKSGFYHYWSALRILGFIEQASTYTLTSRGRTLLANAQPATPLTITEKRLFREAMLASTELWENFFFLFTGQRIPTQHPEIGGTIAFTPVTPKSYMHTKKYRGYKLRSSRLPDVVIPEDPRIYQIVVAGLRRWGLQCNLVDEIFPPTTSQEYKDVTSFMYLIDPDKDSKLHFSTFTSILQKYRNYGSNPYKQTTTFNIPELLSVLCPAEGIRLTTAQHTLMEWITHNKRYTVLQRPSVGLIEEQQGYRNRQRIKQSQPWLVKEGLIYTSLLVQTTIFDEKV